MIRKYAEVNPKADLRYVISYLYYFTSSTCTISRLAKAFILFQQDIKYINLSRANTAELLAKPHMAGLPILTIH
jgi:hypothetical protein